MMSWHDVIVFMELSYKKLELRISSSCLPASPGMARSGLHVIWFPVRHTPVYHYCIVIRAQWRKKLLSGERGPQDSFQDSWSKSWGGVGICKGPRRKEEREGLWWEEQWDACDRRSLVTAGSRQHFTGGIWTSEAVDRWDSSRVVKKYNLIF